MLLDALVLAAAVVSATKRPLAPDDVYALRSITSLEVSPDGKTLAYTIERADKKEDSFRHELWIVGADGRNARRVCRVTDDCSDAKFSPDGTRIAYLSDGTDSAQLWVARTGAGRGRAITDFDEAIGDFDWAPDGSRLVVEKIDPVVRKTDDAPWVITGQQIQRDGTGFVDGRRTHLFIVPASGGTPKALTS